MTIFLTDAIKLRIKAEAYKEVAAVVRRKLYMVKDETARQYMTVLAEELERSADEVLR